MSRQSTARSDRTEKRQVSPRREEKSQRFGSVGAASWTSRARSRRAVSPRVRRPRVHPRQPVSCAHVRARTTPTREPPSVAPARLLRPAPSGLVTNRARRAPVVEPRRESGDRHGQVSPGQAAREGLVRVRRARDPRERSEQEVRRGALASRAPSRRVRARSTPRKNGSGVGNAAARGRSRGEPRRANPQSRSLPIPPRHRRRRKRWTSRRCPRRSATRASRRRSS